MNKYLLALSIASILSLPVKVQAQARMIEKVEQKANEVTIPFEKYVLPNGLTVILHEDHSDPIVHVDITYHVGSAREELGKSGFAHFFEHMMFQGSDNVADEQHFKIITEAGGTLNGTTNRDRTNYFETVPANQLEKMLWLEADRMGFLLDAVTQEKFEIQRATVKNERGQRYDNQPYGLVGEVTSKNLYDYGHPYSWMTIGYVEDLNRVGVNDLKNFFKRWYGPNNAVLTIGGDINKEQTLAWIQKYFGSIPKGVEVNPVKLAMPAIQNNRYVTMSDNYAKTNMMRMVFPTPPSYSKEEAALDCVAEILGQGKSSLLYKNLVKAGHATSASVYNAASELAGEFTISVTPFPGKQLADMHKIVLQSIEEFSQRGVTDEDLLKFKNQQEANAVYALESVSGKVSQLAAYYTFTGDANYFKKDLERYLSLTKEDVMSAFNKYIKGKNSLTVSVVTKADPNNEVAKPNYAIEEVDKFKPNYGYEGLTYNKPKDNFDRSVMPKEGEQVVVKAPSFWTSKINGNMQAIGTQSNEIPVVTLLIDLKAGSYNDPVDKTGLASLFAMMMNEDTKNYSAEAFSDALDKLGSSININAGGENISIQVHSLAKNLDATLALLEERLMNPAFNQEDFDRLQKRTIENIKNSSIRPTYIASTVYQKLSYDNMSPLGRNSTEATIANINLQDIQNYYKTNFSKNEGKIVVVGDISEKDITKKLGFLKKFNNYTVALPDARSISMPANTQKGEVVYIVNVPGAAQTEFRIGQVTGRVWDYMGNHYKSNIVNYPLGGAFNSRLNLYLREEKGWTYGARSGFSANKYTGSYSFSGGIKADPTDSALVDVLRIIDEYKKKGISNEELAFTKSALSNIEALKYETGFQKANFLNTILYYNLPADYTIQQANTLKNLTREDINRLALSQIPGKNDIVILLVGDKAKIEDKIKALGYEIIELDNQGNIK